MKKGELIKKLQELPGGDEMEVVIFDHEKTARTDDGDGSCDGVYSDF